MSATDKCHGSEVSARRPILMGQAQEIPNPYIRPDVQFALDSPGIWIGGDSRHPDIIVPLWSEAGALHSLVKDAVLNPERFVEHLTLRGPFTPNGGGADFPRIVCLCGSTRFWRQFQKSSLEETLASRIVLSIGAAVATDGEHFGHMPASELAEVKARLDELHKRKIDLAGEILVLNVGGYVGESTTSEIKYAQATGKRIRWLEPEDKPAWFDGGVS